MEPIDEVKAAKHTLSTFEKLVRSGQMEKALHLESKVLDAIKVRSRDVRPGGTCSIDLSSIYRDLGDIYRSCVTKHDGCDKAISYYRKGQELGRVYEAATGLDFFDAEIIECYLDFDRCGEAVEVFKEAVSRFKNEEHRVGPQGGGLGDRFVLNVANELRQKNEHKHVLEILDLVKDDIDTCWGPLSSKYCL